MQYLLVLEEAKSKWPTLNQKEPLLGRELNLSHILTKAICLVELAFGIMIMMSMTGLI